MSEIEQESVETIESEPFDYAAKQSEKASSGGWKPLDDWIEDGKDPEEWVDATTFNVRGEFIGKLKAKDKDIDERLANVNKIHAAQLDAERNRLMNQRDAAVLEGGRDNLETVKNLDYQMNQLNQSPIPVAKDPAISDWESNNSWIDTPGPKSVYANSLFSQSMARGESIQQALQIIDSEIARQYPTQTLEKQSMTEGGSKPGGKPRSKSLSMGDVTAEEMKWRDAMPDAWTDDAKFLKAVQDSRKST
jgi:hypothetical protein|tara:strand:+ start:1527 stop:2270 length:744 start_codon:yes stop_codon:yes gene_type:complete